MAGLRAYLAGLKARIVGDPLSPEAVAGGWALGMFVGCAVPFGLQLVVSVPLAMMLRVSKIGATVATFITNPVTIFFIYPFQTWLAFEILFSGHEMGRLPEEWTREAVLSMSGPVVVSYFVGGLLLGLVLTPVTYFLVRGIVRRHRMKTAR